MQKRTAELYKEAPKGDCGKAERHVSEGSIRKGIQEDECHSRYPQLHGNRTNQGSMDFRIRYIWGWHDGTQTNPMLASASNQ